MVHSPQISVIIPIYKAENYINRCIDSILAQKYTDWELLLVDDGSPDRSGTICDEYAQRDFRIRVMHKQNGGVSSARNLGLENAQGEFITFVDADDYIGPSYLQSLIDNKDYDLILTGRTLFGDNGEQGLFDNEGACYEDITNLIKDWKESFDKKGFTIGGLSFVTAKAIRSSIIKDNNIRFSQEMKLGEDTCLIFDCLRYSRNAKIIQENGYYYYLPPVAHTYRFDLNQCMRHCQIYTEKVKEIEKAYGIYPRGQVDAYCAMIFQYYYLSLFNGNLSSFIRNMVEYSKQKKQDSQLAYYETLITNGNRRTFFAIKHPFLFYIYKAFYEL